VPGRLRRIHIARWIGFRKKCAARDAHQFRKLTEHPDVARSVRVGNEVAAATAQGCAPGVSTASSTSRRYIPLVRRSRKISNPRLIPPWKCQGDTALDERRSPARRQKRATHAQACFSAWKSLWCRMARISLPVARVHLRDQVRKPWILASADMKEPLAC